ncbi:MAG: YihY/virulence factor BrkB family protein [Bacteroidetes bacterium]|nr:YihY/virulence factor BrkB family protein [Bacteroidota bacterium]
MNAATLWRAVRTTAQNLRLPLFDGLSAYDVAVFFGKGIYEGSVTSRAASISFSFFLALFPGVIFLFTLIPFIPVEGFQSELFKLLRDVLPPNSFDAAYSTITDILTIKRGDLLSVTVIAAFFFATNGTLSLIGNFGQSIHRLNVRGFWSQYLAAFLLTLALSVLLISGITALTLSEVYLSEWIGGELGIWLAALSRWVVLLGLVLLSISLLFYFGPMRRAPWRFVSPGALLATLLVWLTSYLFGIYVTDFGRYNQLYGSIGTLMIIQLWIYVNAIGLIIGFELNASMAEAKNRLHSR